MSSRLSKVLIFLFLLSNIAVGLFGFFALRSVDEKYSALLLRVVPTLNDLQALSAGVTTAMRQTNPDVLMVTGKSVEPFQSARQAVQNEAQQRSIVLGRYWLPSKPEKRMKFEHAGADFTRAATEFLDVAISLSATEAAQRREQMVRPAFDAYLVAITQATEALHADGIQTSDALTRTTGRLSTIVLAGGSWPAAVLIAILFGSLGAFLLFIRTGIFRSEGKQ